MSRSFSKLACSILSVMFISACGGGGGGSSSPAITPAPNPTPPSSSGYVPGVFPSERNFEASCATPRTGRDAITNVPFPDTQGTTTDEKNWIRSWNNNLYLWYREVPDIDPAINTVAGYFDTQKTSATTPSGTAKDQFHFTANTAEYNQRAQSGVSAGYGVDFAFISSTPPRNLLVAYTQPNTSATSNGVNLVRGEEFISVDGADLINGNAVDTLNAGLFPSALGETHQFEIRNSNTGQTRTVSMTSQSVTIEPVQNVKTIDTPTGKVGYFHFTDHIATAEKALVDAIRTLENEQVTDLVLDLRYNGGGRLSIASQLSYMIAGPANTVGQTFEELQFNDKHQTFDPVTGQRLTPIEFASTTLGSSLPAGDTLPSLNLSRVFVLTSPNTCSASEAIMNGLRGVDIEVIQIGNTTCGKPYGFYPFDNCGTTYFTVQFRGVNAKNFGDYSDGFSPANTVGVKGTEVTGCSVADDFSKSLGDPTERRLEAALNYRQTSTCPAATSGSSTSLTGFRLDATEGRVIKHASVQNRIL